MKTQLQLRKEAVEKAVNSLKDALLESIEASQAEEDAKQRKILAHHNLSLSRDALRGIEHEQY